MIARVATVFGPKNRRLFKNFEELDPDLFPRYFTMARQTVPATYKSNFHIAASHDDVEKNCNFSTPQKTFHTKFQNFQYLIWFSKTYHKKMKKKNIFKYPYFQGPIATWPGLCNVGEQT